MKKHEKSPFSPSLLRFLCLIAYMAIFKIRLHQKMKTSKPGKMRQDDRGRLLGQWDGGSNELIVKQV